MTIYARVTTLNLHLLHIQPCKTYIPLHVRGVRMNIVVCGCVLKFALIEDAFLKIFVYASLEGKGA